MISRARPYGFLLILGILAILALGCGSEEGSDSVPSATASEQGRETSAQLAMPLERVIYWAYQLQDLSMPGAVDALANSHYDMLVLEPTRTDWSSDDRYFDTKSMVTRLKGSFASDGVHRKLVLAYVDIGEAEDWRWYWTWSRDWNCKREPPRDWPGYILACDPDGWEGNSQSPTGMRPGRTS